jgi:hypothetical protein
MKKKKKNIKYGRLWGYNKNKSIIIKERKTRKTPWTESASELYLPSDRRLSAKLVPTFADRVGTSFNNKNNNIFLLGPPE